MLDVTNGTSGAPTVASASYGIAGQLTGMSYFGWSESREFNNLLQMTHQWVSNGSSNVMDMRYNYTAGANNGRITSSVDGIIGETVNYTYDSLSRLSSAAATNGAWNQSYTYDGFGNLTTKMHNGGYAFQLAFDPATNHQIGVGYDANGNPTGPSYDVENRMTGANGETYSYDHAGKRVLKQYTIAAPSPNAGSPGFELYFYGIGGQKLMTKQCWMDQDGFPHCPGGNGGNSGDYFNTYFGGKLVKSKNVVVAADRLGSVRANSTGEQFRYYPYGEERTSTADGREKFGTYMRDNPGQDYADHRYYSVGTGRYYTPESYRVDPVMPGKLNQFAYVQGDPINFTNPHGGELSVEEEDYEEIDVPDVDQKEGKTKGPTGGGGAGKALPNTQQRLTGVFQNLPGNCQKEISDRYSINGPQGIIAKTAQVSSYNVDDPANKDVTLGQLLGNFDLTTLQSALTIDVPGVTGGFQATAVVPTYGSGKPSTIILVGAVYFSADQAQQDATLIHEMLHIYSGLNDQGLAAKFNLGTFADSVDGQLAASLALGKYFDKGCIK
jgi:RHS repeat-associated protein